MTDQIHGLPPLAPHLPGSLEAPVPGARPGGAEDEGFRLQFSKHAAKRLEQRGLDLDTASLERLNQAVEQAEARGARDSVVLLDELALIVSVQNRTVVTAMGEAGGDPQVFTNIDSVVIAP